MQRVILGVDIGGSKILSGILTPEGKILACRKEATHAERDAAHILDDICAYLKGLQEEMGISDRNILGVAVGAPGPIDYNNGIIKDPPNLNWRNFPLRDELSKRLGGKLLLDNDANLAAWGEYKYGGSTPGSNLIYITVSTGIGGGIIINGRLYRGRDGEAGEFGRLQVEHPSRADYNGPAPCLEDLASGTAIARAGQKLIQGGKGQEILDFCHDGRITSREIGSAARNGVPAAMHIINQAGLYLSMAVANLIHIFNPDQIVLGGGVGLGLQDLLEPMLQANLNKWMDQYQNRETKIEFTKLGENIGLLGCAAAVLEAAGEEQ